jgi:hypothetical protein
MSKALPKKQAQQTTDMSTGEIEKLQLEDMLVETCELGKILDDHNVQQDCTEPRLNDSIAYVLILKVKKDGAKQSGGNRKIKSI